MSGYAVYRYYGARPNAVDLKSGGWASFLAPRLWQFKPGSGAPREARLTNLAPLPISPAGFLWNAVFMGYGLPSHYVSLFLLKFRHMTPHESQDLLDWIVQRARTVAASHDIFVADGLTHVVRKSIYPLIESSEANWSSYLIGNAFAQTCVPLHLKRKMATKAKIAPILYHASLLANAAAIGIHVSYAGSSNVDLVAFDSRYDMHFVESKGDGGIYPAWINSLYQCMGVVSCSFNGVDWSAPASLTSSVAFGASRGVYCGAVKVGPGIRSVLTDIPVLRTGSYRSQLKALTAGTPPAPAPMPMPRDDMRDERMRVAQLLAGFRLLSTCLVVKLLHPERGDDDWTICRYSGKRLATTVLSSVSI